MDSEVVCGAIVLVITILFVSTFVFSGSFVDDSVAVNALEVQGFSNVTIVDKDWYFVEFKGGSGDDRVKFTVMATNPAGKNVTVTVFAGWPFKGATVRV